MRPAAKTDSKPKYGNRKTVVDGITFDSAKEANRYRELKILERVGIITTLRRQSRIHMHGRDDVIRTPTGRTATYVADFTYLENGVLVIEDAKGFRTPEYKLKRAILAAMGLTIREV